MPKVAIRMLDVKPLPWRPQLEAFYSKAFLNGPTGEDSLQALDLIFRDGVIKAGGRRLAAQHGAWETLVIWPKKR